MTSFADRFWARVVKGDGCWEWTGYRDRRGYGRVMVEKKPRAAHRIAWQLDAGSEIPVGMLVCHRCDNPACVRPDHLFLGTCRDNTADMMSKGRWGGGPMPPGERHPRAKLTAEDVRQVRILAALKISQTWAANIFGVSPSAIQMVVSGRNWK